MEMTMTPQDDLTAERAAQLYGSLTCTTYREGYQDPENDIALIAEELKTTRQEARREAAKVAKAYIKARDDSRYMSESEDCERWKASYRVYADAADALDRLASEGG